MFDASYLVTTAHQLVSIAPVSGLRKSAMGVLALKLERYYTKSMFKIESPA